MLVIETLPLSLSAPVGLNCTLNMVLCPADKVMGAPAPTRAKFVPVMLTCEMVTLALPVLVSVTDFEALLPALTLPKLRLLALAESVCVAVVLLPVSETVDDEELALLTSDKVPVTLPAVCGAKTTVNEAFCPAEMLAGKVRPLMLKPLPVTFAWETVSVALPVLLICRGWELLVPVVMLGKVMAFCERDRAAWAPEPVTLTWLVPLWLTTETEPVVAAVVDGLKTTVNMALCEGAKVSGVLMLVRLRPEPVIPICEIVAELLPVFVTVTVLLAELPTLTLPKLSEDGFGDKVLVAATPVPLQPIIVAELEALLVRLMLPLAAPAVCGANCTLKVLLWDAGMVSGVVIPLTVVPVPVADICEIFRSAVPVLVMVTDWDLDWPSIRLPKLMLAGETLMAG